MAQLRKTGPVSNLWSTESLLAGATRVAAESVVDIKKELQDLSTEELQAELEARKG